MQLAVDYRVARSSVALRFLLSLLFAWALHSFLFVCRKVLELIEVVQRGGLAAPWLAIPALVSLVTDPAPDVSSRAIKVLKQVCLLQS